MLNKTLHKQVLKSLRSLINNMISLQNNLPLLSHMLLRGLIATDGSGNAGRW